MGINTNITSDSNQNFLKTYNNEPIEINGLEWDYVFGFFKKFSKDELSAEDFALSIFKVAEQTGFNATEIIQTMEGQDGMQLTASLAYYLNSIRSNSTMLGVQNIVKPNFYAGRSVLI